MKECRNCGIELLIGTKLSYCIDCNYYKKANRAIFQFKNKSIVSKYNKIDMLYFFYLVTKPLLHMNELALVKKRKIEYPTRLRRRYTWIKSSAKKRNLDFNIDVLFLGKLLNNPCFYCKKLIYNFSVDRMDNTKGYTPQNTVACCRSCNSKKSIKSVEKYLQAI